MHRTAQALVVSAALALMAGSAFAHCCHDERAVGIQEQSGLRRGVHGPDGGLTDEAVQDRGDLRRRTGSLRDGGSGSLGGTGGLGQMHGGSIGSYGGGSVGERGPGGLGSMRNGGIGSEVPRPR